MCRLMRKIKTNFGTIFLVFCIKIAYIIEWLIENWPWSYADRIQTSTPGTIFTRWYSHTMFKKHECKIKFSYWNNDKYWYRIPLLHNHHFQYNVSITCSKAIFSMSSDNEMCRRRRWSYLHQLRPGHLCLLLILSNVTCKKSTIVF